jgi:hypothetical protein
VFLRDGEKEKAEKRQKPLFLRDREKEKEEKRPKPVFLRDGEKEKEEKRPKPVDLRDREKEKEEKPKPYQKPQEEKPATLCGWELELSRCPRAPPKPRLAFA